MQHSPARQSKTAPTQALLLRDLRLSDESTAAAFARIDTNRDGLVSHEELCAAGVTKTLADAMMERGDVTGDGLLDMQQMRRLALVDDESAPRAAARRAACLCSQNATAACSYLAIAPNLCANVLGLNG